MIKKHLNFPTLILGIFILRLLITGAGIGDAIVILALSLLYGGWVYLDSKKEIPVNIEIINKIDTIETNNIIKITTLESELKSLKDKLNTITMGMLRK